MNTLRSDIVTSFLHNNDVRDRCAASVQLFVICLSLWMVWVCEIMGKNNGDPDLVCENYLSV